VQLFAYPPAPPHPTPPPLSKTKATKIGAPIAKRRTKPGSEKKNFKKNPSIPPPL